MLNNKKIGMIFPGYGAQFVGMGKELYDTSRTMQEYFEEASTCLNMNFVKLCFAASEAELSSPHNAYTSLFLIEVSCAALLREAGIKPDVVAGYGMGMYGALWTAKGFNFPDGLYLLRKLAQWYEEFLEKNNIKMVRVRGVTRKALEELCTQYSTDDGYAAIALTDVVADQKFFAVAGNRRIVELIEEHLPQSAVRSEMKPEGGVYISHVTAELSTQFVPYLEKVDFVDLEVPCVNAHTGALMMTGVDVREAVAQHVSQEQRLDKMLKKVADCDVLIIPFPDTALRDYLVQEFPDKEVKVMASPADLQEIIAAYTVTTQSEKVEEGV